MEVDEGRGVRAGMSLIKEERGILTIVLNPGFAKDRQAWRIRAFPI